LERLLLAADFDDLVEWRGEKRKERVEKESRIEAKIKGEKGAR